MQITPTDHPSLPVLFETVELRYRMEAIAIGTSPGQVWTDDPQHPRSALIWDGGHCLYLGGVADNPTFNADLQSLMTEAMLPAIQERGLQVLKVHTTHDNWMPLVEQLFRDYSIQPRRRVLYRLDASAVPQSDWQANSLPSGLKLRLIDAELLENTTLPQLEEVRGEIESGWISVERFLQEGIGCCIVHESDGVVCWCTAEYVSSGKCGVGIETVESYQGQGLATATASAFIQQAAVRGWQVYWDSWLANTPSTRVAEKVGFEKLTEYDIRLVML